MRSSSHSDIPPEKEIPSGIDPASAPDVRPRRQEREPATDAVTELAPGVLRSQLPVQLPGLGHVNCYFLEDENGVALVDPGLPGPESFNALKSRLATAGYAIENVHTVVLTHSHLDHFGGANKLRTLTGAKIIAHERFRPTWHAREAQEPVELPSRGDAAHYALAEKQHNHSENDEEDDYFPPWIPFRTTPWGTRRRPLSREMATHWKAVEADDPTWFSTPEPTLTVRAGEVLTLARRDWLCVHTPGHTEDHLCLYDPAYGLMLSGDHVLPTITPHIGGISSQPDPLSNFLGSLRRMHDYKDVRIVLPAHGHPFEDLYGRSEEIVRHHTGRLDVIRAAAGTLGTGTVTDYMKKLFPQRVWGDLAESETFAHLEHLRLGGEVTGGWKDGLRTYSMP